MEVLNCLHDIAEDGYLYCGCGNAKIDVDILPDRLELHCGECGATATVFAETEEDLDAIKSLGVIELVKNGFDWLDTPGKTPTQGIGKGVGKRKKSKQHR